jgi:hypothetical protein
MEAIITCRDHVRHLIATNTVDADNDDDGLSPLMKLSTGLISLVGAQLAMPAAAFEMSPLAVGPTNKLQAARFRSRCAQASV